MASSETGGVKPFSIAGRYVSERERLNGMTDAERAYRAQYLKDQELAPHEPVYVPELVRERFNPIRRMYRLPLDTLQQVLSPALGNYRAYATRYWTGKFLMATFGVYSIYYYFKYNTNDWTRKGSWRVTQARVAVVPGDPGFPKLSERSKPADYADRGFKNAPI